MKGERIWIRHGLPSTQLGCNYILPLIGRYRSPQSLAPGTFFFFQCCKFTSISTHRVCSLQHAFLLFTFLLVLSATDCT